MRCSLYNWAITNSIYKLSYGMVFCQARTDGDVVIKEMALKLLE